MDSAEAKLLIKELRTRVKSRDIVLDRNLEEIKKLNTALEIYARYINSVKTYDPRASLAIEAVSNIVIPENKRNLSASSYKRTLAYYQSIKVVV